MRSVAGVALIAPALGRASKKIINIMHTVWGALFLEAKVAVGKNKATKAIDNWKGSVQRKVLVERSPRFRWRYPVRAPGKGPQIANPRPTPKPGNLGPPWPPGTSGDPAWLFPRPPPRGLKIIVGSFGIPWG